MKGDWLDDTDRRCPKCGHEEEIEPHGLLYTEWADKQGGKR